MAEAMTRSCVVARIQIPYFPRLRKSQSAPIMAPASIAVATRYHGYWR